MQPLCSISHPRHHAGARASRVNHKGAHATREGHTTRNHQEHALQSVGVVGWHMVDHQDAGWRGESVGPHAHGNVARRVVDDPISEGSGQQKPYNDPSASRLR